MNGARDDDLSAVRAIDIGAISISAPSRLAAQRIADALPAAIARALSGGRAGHDPADRAAVEIVAAIRAQVTA